MFLILKRYGGKPFFFCLGQIEKSAKQESKPKMGKQNSKISKKLLSCSFSQWVFILLHNWEKC